MSNFKAIMYRYDFGYGSVPDPYGFNGPTSRGGREREEDCEVLKIP